MELQTRWKVGRAGRRSSRNTPYARPERIKKSPAPFVHAATRATRLFCYQLYSEFLDGYRAPAEKLRAGKRSFRFPVGCFPPPLPFVSG